MEIEPSDRLKSIGSYAFDEVDKQVAKLKSYGITPIDFGVGDPKEPTHGFIRNHTKRAIDKRKDSGYPSYIGSSEFRQAIAEWSRNRFNISLNPDTEITSTIGAKEGVFNFHEGFVNNGDYVLMPNPGYPPYERGTLFAEGRPYFMNLTADNDFLPKLDDIPRDVIRKAKIMWINFPGNPTAAMAPKPFLKETIDFCHDNEIILASDECYTEIYYDEKPLSALELDREGVVVFQSMSKRSNMTGYRVGWAMGDEKIISIFRKVKTNIDSGTPTFLQDSAIAALQDESHVEKMRGQYRVKRDIIIDALKDLGLKDCTPKATLYIWQKTPKDMSSVEFAKKLLYEDIAIVTTPGAWVSKDVNGKNPGEGYVRFALVPSIQECKLAAERLRGLKF